MNGAGVGLRFTLGGTPVRIDLTFLGIVVVLGLSLADDPWRMAVWVLLVTVSVLVHEAGHVWALRRNGRDSEVVLAWLGGATISSSRRELAPWRSIGISVAGPLAGMSFGLLLAAVLNGYDAPTAVWVRDLSWFINIWWSMFNLLPVMPLDGGHVMRELFTLASASIEKTIAALGVLLGAAATSIALVLTDNRYGWFALAIVALAATNLGSLALTRRQRRTEELRALHRDLLDGSFEPAAQRLLDATNGDDRDLVSVEAYTTLAWVMVHLGDFRRLEQIDLARVAPTHRALLEAALAWYRGDVAQANALVTHALANGSVDPPDSYFHRTFGRLGETDQLRMWIDQLPRDERERAALRLNQALAARG